MRRASFQIDGNELRRRRLRCRPLLPSVGELPSESLERCSVCASSRHFVLTPNDRYGLALRAAMCMDCGVVFQIDRFTREGFAEFYAGSYRALVSAFKGKDEGDVERLKGKQVVYGQALLEAFKDRIQGPVERIADIGGSTGVVAGIFCDAFAAKATIVDPAGQELEAADPRFSTAQATLEDWQPEGSYDLVLLCNTIEHLHDLGASFAKLRGALKPHGWLLCDIADFMASCRLEGTPEIVAKVDHCFWLSLETAESVFQRLGFRITAAAYGRLPQQVSFLLQPLTEVAALGSDPAVTGMLAELQSIRGEWLDFSHRADTSLRGSRLSAAVRRLLARVR